MMTITIMMTALVQAKMLQLMDWIALIQRSIFKQDEGEWISWNVFIRNWRKCKLKKTIFNEGTNLYSTSTFSEFCQLMCCLQDRPRSGRKSSFEIFGMKIKKTKKIKRQKNYSQKTNKHQDGANLDSPDLDTALLYTVMDNIRRSWSSPSSS